MKIPNLNSTSAALAATALLSVAATPPTRAAERTTNVVIIYTDDQGYADVGSFGAQGLRTPNLDQLAREGRRFTNFHVSQPICTASRASLLTGCYPNRIGFRGALSPHSVIGLNENELTLAQMFKNQDYATGMVGKWHLGDAPQFLPTKRGFDQYYGIPYSHDMWTRHPESPGAYPPLPLIDNETVVNADLHPDDLAQLTQNYTKRAVKFIDANAEKPFFLYLAHNMPHVPLYASAQFKGRSQRGIYGDVIEELDWSIGQITEALKRNDLGENTLVIFASDNGPWLNYGTHGGSSLPLREVKHTNWEGGTRVPCIMRWLGQIPAGTTSDEMLMNLDLFPTLAKKLGLTMSQNRIDGLDVWPIIAGEKGATNPHQAYYFYYGNNELQAVMSGDGRWKLQLPHTYPTLNGRIGRDDGKPVAYDRDTIERAELYDLKNDIGETKDVAAKYPEIVARLQADAEKARADLGDSLLNREGNGKREPGRTAPLDPELVGKELTISCKVTRREDDGVILAQGGVQNGYALHLQNGKLVFSVRQNGNSFVATAPDAAPAQFSVRAQLQKDGAMTLEINGAPAATGKAPGLFKAQPTDALSIGADSITAVGDYKAPNALKGKVENVKIEAL